MHDYRDFLDQRRVSCSSGFVLDGQYARRMRLAEQQVAELTAQMEAARELERAKRSARTRLAWVRRRGI